MNALSTALFFLFAAVVLAGGLAGALARSRSRRGLGLIAVAVGTAGVYLLASAGYAALAVLIAYLALGALFAHPNLQSLRREAGTGLAQQIGALGAAGLLVLLGYAAFRGSYVRGGGPPGVFDAGDVGRLLFTHEALAVEAVGALLLAGISGAAFAWWGRER